MVNQQSTIVFGYHCNMFYKHSHGKQYTMTVIMFKPS